MRIIRIFLAMAVCLGAAATAVAADPAPAAGKAVDTLHQALLDVMKRSDTLGYKGRYAALEPVVSKNFDFETIGRLVLGKHWAALKPEQQNEFLSIFSKLSTATYASRFDSFSGESFRGLGEQKHNENNILVKTELVRTSDKPVSLNYVLHAGSSGEWRIVNVIADGISDVSLKRSEYTSILNNGGFDTLIAKLNAKIAQYESPAAATP